MKTLALVVLLLATPLAHGTESTVYYWGFAESQTSAAKSSKTMVLGKRTLNDKTKVKSDTQLYASKEDAFSEFRYDLDFKTNKMTVFTTGNKKQVGSGTFKCDGPVEKHTHCDYEYATTGTGAYKATGKDFATTPGVVYREEDTILYDGSTEETKFSVDFYPIDKSFYEDFRSRMLKHR